MRQLSTTKKLVLGVCTVLGLYGLLIGAWATRPMSDTVPVGIDWSPTVASPPRPQQLVSQRVSCNSLFSATALAGPLPALTPQPADRAPLRYQRPPCELVHQDARKVLVVDTVVALGIIAALIALRARLRRSATMPLVAHNLAG